MQNMKVKDTLKSAVGWDVDKRISSKIGRSTKAKIEAEAANESKFEV